MTQPFVEHVRELRRRLSVTVAVLVVGAGTGYLAREPILSWLQAPLHGTLYYSQVMGAFEFLMQACLLVGILFAIPVAIYNVVEFIRPALPRPVSRKQVFSLVAASCSLTIGGAAFGYYVSLPVVLRFLSSIDVRHLHPLIAANSYLSFVVTYLAVFAVIFQLPLLLLFFDHITPIPPSRLKHWRKWIIIGAFSAALILPIAPDPVSQTMLALPVVVLYEVSLWLVVIAHRLRDRQSRTAVHAPAAVVAPMPVPTPPSPAPSPPAKAAAPRPTPATRIIDLRPRVIDLRQY